MLPFDYSMTRIGTILIMRGGRFLRLIYMVFGWYKFAPGGYKSDPTFVETYYSCGPTEPEREMESTGP
ncbi:hypothetical protein JZ751_018648, partial [Albula glossodonta]